MQDEKIVATYATVTDAPSREAPWVDVPEAQPRARFRSKDVTRSVRATVTADGRLHYDPETTEYDAYAEHPAMRQEAEEWEYLPGGKVLRTPGFEEDRHGNEPKDPPARRPARLQHGGAATGSGAHDGRSVVVGSDEASSGTAI